MWVVALFCCKIQLLLRHNPDYSSSDYIGEFFCKYLTERTRSVEVTGQQLNHLEVLDGVPQGSLLGPFLFTLFGLELHTNLKHTKIDLYADDMQIYLLFKPERLDDDYLKLQ